MHTLNSSQEHSGLIEPRHGCWAACCQWTLLWKPADSLGPAAVWMTKDAECGFIVSVNDPFLLRAKTTIELLRN
jgi:hypothetical protein